MLLAITFTLWIAVSAAVHRYLSKTLPPAIHVMAGAMAVGLGAVGFVNLLQVHLMPVTRTYSDTYYVVSKGYFWLNMASFYLVAAGLALLIWKLARGLPKRLLVSAFWVFHIGAGAVVVPAAIAPYLIPKRYVDFPDSLYWSTMMSSFGAQLIFLGAACLLILAIIALGQRLLQGRVG